MYIKKLKCLLNMIYLNNNKTYNYNDLDLQLYTKSLVHSTNQSKQVNQKSCKGVRETAKI